MTQATVSDPYVVSLLVTYENGSVSGLAADVAYDVQVGEMEVITKQQVDAWALFNAGDIMKFKALLAKILDNA